MRGVGAAVGGENLVGAHAGGCWYCGIKERDLVFCWEFDTYVHVRCVQVRLSLHPDDEEAKLIAAEVIG